MLIPTLEYGSYGGLLELFGKVPVSIVVLKSVATNGAMTEAQFLRIEADIPSDPGDLEVSRSFKSE